MSERSPGPSEGVRLLGGNTVMVGACRCASVRNPRAGKRSDP